MTIMACPGNARPIILCFVAYYLPGYRSGGPVRSISNFVDHLGDDFDIRIVTQDRDALDRTPYPTVEIDKWQKVGNAHVFYAAPKTLTLFGIARLIRDTPHDVLYLNSFFDPRFTVLPLMLRRMGVVPRRPCVLAPRGEFSEGALELKGLKKRVFLEAVRFLGFYDGVLWQASSQFEAEDIHRTLGTSEDQIVVAPNLPGMPSDATTERYVPRTGALRLIFLSRISRMKNLDFLLRLLRKSDVDLELDIFGVVDDLEYWNDCKDLIAQLPPSVRVRYQGSIPHYQVSDVLSQYELFVLPTRGENYGHAIVESLAQGTPVLISDQTPWRDLRKFGAGWDLPLRAEDGFLDAIRQVDAMSRSDYQSLRSTAAQYARLVLGDEEVVKDNITILTVALQNG